MDFSSNPWPNISAGAKDLVRKMLNSDPKRRLTAFQVLGMQKNRKFCPLKKSLSAVDHPWIKDGEAPDIPLDNAVLNRLKQFRAMNKFNKVALRVSPKTLISLSISVSEIFCVWVLKVIAGCLSEEIQG